MQPLHYVPSSSKMRVKILYTALKELKNILKYYTQH
jgi:hypothetical protein